MNGKTEWLLNIISPAEAEDLNNVELANFSPCKITPFKNIQFFHICHQKTHVKSHR